MTFNAERANALSYDDFLDMRNMILEQSGIWLGDNKTVFLEARLSQRLRACNIASALEYYHYIKYDPHGAQEIQRLIDAIVVNESWFFRETDPVEAWCKLVLPDLLKTTPPVRLWSAGCACGEEPYSLAMLIQERHPLVNRSQVNIWATDISWRALDTARAGSYDPHSLRHTQQRWLAKYFQPTQDNFMAVNGQARKMVHFEYFNLIKPIPAPRMRSVDMILCRNVIIYFDAESRKKVLENFYTVLKPGGHLLLGHSESLAHTTTPFEMTRLGECLVYRKPVDSGQ